MSNFLSLNIADAFALMFNVEEIMPLLMRILVQDKTGICLLKTPPKRSKEDFGFQDGLSLLRTKSGTDLLALPSSCWIHEATFSNKGSGTPARLDNVGGRLISAFNAFPFHILFSPYIN